MTRSWLVALVLLSLVSMGQAESSAAAPGPGDVPPVQPWWNEGMGGWVGGIVGIYGGLMGAAIGFLASRTGFRRLASALVLSFIPVGAALLGAGVVAMCRRQPYFVDLPLVLSGSLCALLPLVSYLTLRRLRTQGELRKMRAMDVS